MINFFRAGGIRGTFYYSSFHVLKALRKGMEMKHRVIREYPLFLYRKADYYIKLFNSLKIPRNSASLSFYTIVSIFPLCYFVVNLMSYFISYEVMVGEILQFVDEFLPY